MRGSLVLFKGLCVGWRGRVIPRFHLFFLMLMNGKKEKDGFKIFLRGSSDGITLLRSYANC